MEEDILNVTPVYSKPSHLFILDKYREYQWIGLNDKTIEGDFRWSDGNPLVSLVPAGWIKLKTVLPSLI